MKILYIFNHPAPYKVNLLQELGKYHTIDVIFERKKNKDRPNKFYDNHINGLNIHYLSGLKIGNENHLSTSLKRYIKKNHNSYDIIIMNGYSTFTEMLALNYMITKKIPYILYINGGIIKKSSNLKDKLKRKYISNACAYFSPCQEANNFLRFYGAKNKIFNYPYSTVKELELMPKLQPSAKQDVRSKFKIEGEKTFVYAGQFIERKNNLQLLKIWKDVPKSYTLYLIGQGKQQKELEKAIKKYKLSNVFIREFLIKKDMLQFFRGCDVFITLSKEDIYGHMINEALSQSLPVISSKNVIAASHLIKNNYNGFIVDLDDEKSIINAIKKSIDKSMPRNCFLTALDNTFEKMVEAHLIAFKELEK